MTAWEDYGLPLREAFRTLLDEVESLRLLLAATGKTGVPVDPVSAFTTHLTVTRKAPSTVRQYNYALNAFLTAVGKAPYEVTRRDVLSYLESGVGLGWAATTQNNRLNVLRSFFGFLKGEGWVVNDPTERVATAKTSCKSRVYLVGDEVDLVLDSASPGRDRTIVRTAIATGLRVSELEGLDVGDIDKVNSRVVVRRGKGGKSRVVDVDTSSLAILLQHIGGRTKGPLFVNQRNGRLTARSIQRVVKTAAVAVGKRITPHKLRHTFGMWLLNHGASIETVRREMGHSSITTTSIYADVEDSRRTAEYVKSNPFAGGNLSE